MNEYHILNLGAGVQSTALYLLSREPDAKFRFDLAVFADTGEEPTAVYRHLDYLRALGAPDIWVRAAGKLGDDLVNGRNSTGQRFASIPAFTKGPDGKVGIVRRQCTKEYKIDVCERAIRRELLGLKPRQRIPKGVILHQYFGISTDEAARAERAKKRFEGVKHTVPHWPLIEMGWSRKDCLAYLKDKLPHEVPKSSCVFCPYRTNQAWLTLKQTDSDGWKRAVEVDRALRDKGSVVTRGFRQELFVHRSCVPLDVIDFTKLWPNTIDPLTTGECQGMCGL
ncbi:hypothetical protein GobsT_17950 [Gemmata obscuriglobus]|uniref:Phosphoadenosine phosphosulfate reductase n=1 Tax=Gemmata obscuriglobus TaxID=114 RepID=A0A2Z3H9Z5_9BACT|nr:hypothetical protein [Gemmata obscuriglobus]AWM39835.1 hypothetical protein C1280_24390 [Gemmata obscuriglobus]QEG27042.1 hypothetical protein GobsT_17950 [Gemmata obscuriglobus]VTS03419.1 Uncharacterized protein OS=Sphingobium lactosutens DS20 GN=RLDS_11480 PE=4 SV=1 [Gemmata obscuriglobus UQM 2246]